MRKTIFWVCVLVLIVLVLLPAEKDVCDMAVIFNKDGQINFDNSPEISALGGANPYSITAWFNIDAFGTSGTQSNTVFAINYDLNVSGTSDYTGRSGVALQVIDQPGLTDGLYVYRDYTNAADSDNTEISDFYVRDVLSTDVWYFVALTWDESGLPATDYYPTLYLNAVEQAIAPYSVTPSIAYGSFDAFSTTYLTIGSAYREYTADTTITIINNFDGYIQDVRIYNRVLSSDEVQEIYSSRLIVDGIPGKIFHCPMDGAGGSANFGSLDSNDTIWDVYGAMNGSIFGTLNGLQNTIQTYGGK